MSEKITDKNSVEWLIVKSFCEKRLEELRAENDNELNHGETAMIRGQIKFIKEILELEKNEQKPEVSGTTYIE